MASAPLNYADPAVIAEQLRKRGITPASVLPSDALKIDLAAGMANAYQYPDRFKAAWFYSGALKLPGGKRWTNKDKPPAGAIAQEIGSTASRVSDFIGHKRNQIPDELVDVTAAKCGIALEWLVSGYRPVPSWLVDYDDAAEAAQVFLMQATSSKSVELESLTDASPIAKIVQRVLFIFDHPSAFLLSESLNGVMGHLVNFPMLRNKVVKHESRQQQEQGRRALTLEATDMTMLQVAFNAGCKAMGSGIDPAMAKRIRAAFSEAYRPPLPPPVVARKRKG